MLSQRTQAIKDSLFAQPRQVTMERARLYMESYKKTQDESPVIRRAKAFKYLLENHKIVLDEYDLLAGNRTDTPRAGVVSPEMSPYWILDELDKFPSRQQDRFEISEEDKTYYKEVLYPFWTNKSLNDWYKAHLAENLAEAQKTRIFSVAQTDKGQGHIICDFPLVLQNGFGALLAEAEQKLAQDSENDFYAAAVIVLKATIAYVRRYEAEVLQTKESAPSEARAQELERLAEILHHIATEPARDFYDALQLTWITELVLQHESNASSISLGRMDQYLAPFYEASLAAGEDPEFLRELIQCFYLKTNTIVFLRSTDSAQFFAGFPSGFNCLEITLERNPGGFASFDDLKRAVKETIAEYVGLMVDGCNVCDQAHKETSPTPLLSVLVHDSLKTGHDITDGGARYNPSGVQGVGTANLADSLLVIKRVVFGEDENGNSIEPVMTYQQLIELLKRNWSAEGDEKIRLSFINNYPKYGNDNDEVDLLGSEFLEFYGREVEKYQNVRGGFFQPGSYTVSAHVPLGAACGATPDGRVAGEQLADGGLSPMVGRDKNGPTASLQSVSKLKNELDTNGSLLNVKFSPSVLQGELGLKKLSAYLRSFSRLGLQHIQFNVVDRATLLDAQQHPEKYQNLVVRVAGYSAMFVELSKAIQDDIINRTEHVL